MSLLLLFIVAFLNSINCDFGNYEPYDYCDPNLKLCPIPRSHTMCQYPVPGLSKNCIPFVSEGLTTAEKHHLLTLHNKLRSRVAMGEEKSNLRALPSASNMLQMYWDVELETIADRWASRCLNVTVTKIHDDCRNTKRFRVSQNVGTIGSKTTITERRVIQIFYRWYIKGKSFNPRIIDAYVDDINKTSEDFVNLIWADTYALGCGSVIFQNNLTDSQNGDGISPWTIGRIVCNYGPAGIIPGKSVYKTGIPCTKCPSGWSCSDEYEGLCVLNGGSIKSSLGKTTKEENEKNMSRISFNDVSSTFMYPYVTSNKVEFPTAENDFHEWNEGSEINKTERNNIKLKVGIYYNGICHCPDITRYGFDKSKKYAVNLIMKMKNIKSWLTTSTGNAIPQNDTGKTVLELQNGDRCYCKTNISNAVNSYKPSMLYLTMFFMITLLLY